MTRKVVALLLMAMMMIQTVGCIKKEAADTSAGVSAENSDSAEAVPEINEDEVADNADQIAREQQQAQAQAEADEIDQKHQDDNQNKAPVDQADFGRAVPCLEETDTWVRTESAIMEDGISRECYQCDEELKYQWESGQSAAADIQEGLNAWADRKNLELSESSKEESLSVALEGEVYSYEAMEDDNGYSMYHRGLYEQRDEYWYGIDFQVIEGVFGDYYDTIGGYLDKLTIS